jgi:quercetin dioxygenase-like cupin family protein
MVRIISLGDTSADLRIGAASHREGRSSVSLHDGEACVLRQTVTALLAGQSMDLERPPSEGWILVLEGELRMQINSDPTGEVSITSGSLMQLPHAPMTLTATEDSSLLLTVAMGDRKSQSQPTSVSASEYAKEVWEDESPAQGDLVSPLNEDQGDFTTPHTKFDGGEGAQVDSPS